MAKCNLNDVEGLKLSYGLSRSRRGRFMPVFQQGFVVWEEVLCILFDHIIRDERIGCYANMFTYNLAANVPNNIRRNPSFCSSI